LYPDQITLPPESLIAGATRNFIFYLYTENKRKQIDADGMIARFSLTDYVNESNVPILTKSCSIVIPEGESLAIIKLELNRNDTLDLYGKYIHQLTINDNGTVAILKGIMDITNNCDKSDI